MIERISLKLAEMGVSPLTQQLILVNGAVVIGAIIAFIYLLGKERLKERGELDIHAQRKARKKYEFYYSNFITRGRFRRIVTKFSTFACYSQDTMIQQSVKTFEHTAVVALLFPLIGLFFLQNILITLVIVFLGYVYYDTTVEKTMDTLYLKILEELSICIQSIRDNYIQSDSVSYSVLKADKGKLLEVPITTIHEILTDVKGKELLDDFCRMSPVRLIKTLAIVCFIVNDVGDEKGENNDSEFAKELMDIRQDVDSEIRRLDKQKRAFKIISFLPIAGLVVAPLIQLYLLNFIPGTSTLLKGMYGMIYSTVLVLSVIYSYYKISIAMRPSIVNQVDKVEWVNAIAHSRKMKPILRNIMPKSYKTRMAAQETLDSSLSVQTMEYLYTSKFVYSIICLVMSFILLVGYTIIAKDALYHNYKSLAFAPLPEVPLMTYEQIQRSDAEYLKLPEVLDEEQTVAFVKARVRGLQEYDYQLQAQRTITKYTKYHNIGFKGWYIFLIYMGGVIGWKLPERLLSMRRKLVTYESVEDVIQLQTMMIVLAHSKMNARRILYWLEKQATIHKVLLSRAFINFTCEPMAVLDRLERAADSVNFKRLVNKLKKIVYSMSVADACSDMTANKAQTAYQADVARNELLENKIQDCRLLAVAPLVITLVGGAVGPVMALGFIQLYDTYTKLQGMM